MFLFFRIRKKERRGVLELTISKDSRTSSPCVLDAHINNLRRIIMSRKKSTGEKEFAVMRFTFILPENIVENKLNNAVINNIDYLKESIRQNGLRQPIDVLP